MSQPWHQSSCRRPDVTIAGGTPFCSACDALADCAVDSNPGPGIPRVPDLPPGGIRNLSWPSSVPYHRDEDGDPLDPAPPSLSQPSLSNSATPSHSSQGAYTPLETSTHIRLLRLSKGALDDPIHGTLITASLDDSTPNFEALSYAWADESGDAARRRVIYLGRFWDILPVTANCCAALRRMRRPERDILVWVDAICIDQGNHTERNNQVGLMARIYSSARELFVYLGEGDKKLEAVVASLDAPFLQAQLADPRLVQELFFCRYFSRMWIIQEVANAKAAVIHYGERSVRWAGLAEKRLRSLFGREIVQTIPTWITTIYNKPRHAAADLPRLLLITAESEAADPRDRIFALFGLLADAAGHGLVADYNLALPEVLTGYAAFVLLKLGREWLLDRAVCGNSLQLPTWVPDWQEESLPRDPGVWDAEVRESPEARSGLRISSSGCLTIPAVTLIDSSDGFELYWVRRRGADFGRHRRFGEELPPVPPGKAVFFRQTNSIFYLQQAQEHSSQRYKIFCRIPLDSSFRVASLQRDPADRRPDHIYEEIRDLCCSAFGNFMDKRLWPMFELERAVTGALGLERRSPRGPARWEDQPPDAYELLKTITRYAENTVRTPDDSMLPLLARLDVWGTAEFWRDVDEVRGIWSTWGGWLDLTSEVAGLFGLEYVSGPELGHAEPRDPERISLLQRWSRYTCFLAQMLAGQKTNAKYGFNRDTRLWLRVGELELDFYPVGYMPVRLISGMEPQELERLVWVALARVRGSAQLLAYAIRGRGPHAWDIWDWSSVASFLNKSALPKPEVVDDMKELFSRIAFLRAVLPWEITWEDVTIC